jgi:hypothetical protein
VVGSGDFCKVFVILQLFTTNKEKLSHFTIEWGHEIISLPIKEVNFYCINCASIINLDSSEKQVMPVIWKVFVNDRKRSNTAGDYAFSAHKIVSRLRFK